MEVNSQLHALAAISSETKTGTHWIGGWVGSTAGLDVWNERKVSWQSRESNLESSGTYPTHYADYAIPDP
jgi:hypothetical protein